MSYIWVNACIAGLIQLQWLTDIRVYSVLFECLVRRYTNLVNCSLYLPIIGACFFFFFFFKFPIRCRVSAKVFNLQSFVGVYISEAILWPSQFIISIVIILCLFFSQCLIFLYLLLIRTAVIPFVYDNRSYYFCLLFFGRCYELTY